MGRERKWTRNIDTDVHTHLFRSRIGVAIDTVNFCMHAEY